MRAALRSRCSTTPAPEVDCAVAPAHGERLHAAAQQEPAVEKFQTKILPQNTTEQDEI